MVFYVMITGFRHMILLKITVARCEFEWVYQGYFPLDKTFTAVKKV
jgi:hypothetical protein